MESSWTDLNRNNLNWTETKPSVGQDTQLSEVWEEKVQAENYLEMVQMKRFFDFFFWGGGSYWIPHFISNILWLLSQCSVKQIKLKSILIVISDCFLFEWWVFVFNLELVLLVLIWYYLTWAFLPCLPSVPHLCLIASVFKPMCFLFCGIAAWSLCDMVHVCPLK